MCDNLQRHGSSSNPSTETPSATNDENATAESREVERQRHQFARQRVRQRINALEIAAAQPAPARAALVENEDEPAARLLLGAHHDLDDRTSLAGLQLLLARLMRRLVLPPRMTRNPQVGQEPRDALVVVRRW